MRVYVRSNETTKLRYRIEKPSLKDYYFSGQVDEATGRIWGDVTKLSPYDDADYYWAKIEGNGLIKFIYNGKVKDKMQTHSYEEEEYDSVNDYFNDIIESAAEELANLNKDIKPRMMYN